MYLLYNIAVYCVGFFLKLIAIFNKKINLFVAGRKEIFPKLQHVISSNDQVIWFHCASLGEFEQGRPIIEKIKNQHPDYKIVLTFFSPSGFEVIKNYALVDIVTYLPLDTKKNVKKFLQITHPKIAVFIKYEFWPNLLNELKKQKIETILVSGIFRENQAFFKKYGKWMVKSLKAFSHFFVQNEKSKILLQQIGFNNVTISGDTRFDRVFEITKQDNYLDFIEKFKQNKYTLVAGSTWPKDEEFLINYINNHASIDEKFIIAPHNINEKLIKNLRKNINKKAILFSEKEYNNNAQVFIVDTIGILTKIYSYADAAYIGGGFDPEGVHNVLEPATFGIPLNIGPVYNKFQEAVDLVNLQACEVLKTQENFNLHFQLLFTDINYRLGKGKISKNYIYDNIGATKIILEYIDDKI